MLNSRSINSRFAVVLALLISIIAELPGQAPPIITLKPANGKSTVEFSSVRTLRELADGKVIIGDSKEKKFSVLDFVSGTSAPMGTRGEGPGEFTSVANLYPLAADSSLMTEGASGRWLIFKGSKPVVTIPASDRLPRLSMSDAEVYGADATGHVVARMLPYVRGTTGLTSAETNQVMRDSTWLVRLYRSSERRDTLGKFTPLMGGGTPAYVNASGAPPTTKPTTKQYAQGIVYGAQVSVFQDGTVALLRGELRRVDWCLPMARCTTGVSLGIPERPYSDAEKQAYLAWEARRIGRLPAGVTIEQISDWTPTVPSFFERMLPTADGKVLLERFPYAGQDKTEYLLVDRKLGAVGRLMLPANQGVIGFGARSVYIGTKDEDGIIRLSRHPWP